MGVPARARQLDGVAGVARPVSLANDRVVPVLRPLEPLFPERGLRRGTLVAVSGSTSLALALVARASADGSWCAAVGLPSLGVVAAAELGIVLERFPLVAAPAHGGAAAWAAAALLDTFDVVVARFRPTSASDIRRLAALARERGAVLVLVGDRVEGADVRLAMVTANWHGVGQGHGRLRARRVEVFAGGRGSATRERRVALWLPSPNGGVAPADDSPVDAAPVEQAPSRVRSVS